MNRDEKLEAALALTFDSDAGDGLTIRGYLRELLVTLWREDEGFSGKRPFGNSGWQSDLYAPLVKAGILKGEVTTGDDWEDVEVYDHPAGHKFIAKLIQYALRDERNGSD